jgi:hypothetical protein
MTKGRVVGIGAYVTVVLVLAVAAWWLVVSVEGRGQLVDEVLPGAEGQREFAEARDDLSLSIARDRPAEDRPAGPDIEDGEPEEGIAGVVLGWVKGLSAIATLFSILGWLIGLVSRHACQRR